MVNYISKGVPRGYVAGLRIGKFIVRDVILAFQIMEIYPAANKNRFLDTDRDLISNGKEFNPYIANKLSFTMECINEWMREFKK